MVEDKKGRQFRSAMALILSLVWIGATQANCNGQEKLTENTFTLKKDQSPGKATIQDVKWLSGHWQGQGFGGEVDEVWSKPKRGHMAGLFRLFKEDKLLFSEYFTISETSGSLTLSLRHFSPTLEAWEEKDKAEVFKLVKVEGKTAYFDGLTYRLADDGTLSALVAMKQKNGDFSELKFELRRQK